MKTLKHRKRNSRKPNTRKPNSRKRNKRHIKISKHRSKRYSNKKTRRNRYNGGGLISMVSRTPKKETVKKETSAYLQSKINILRSRIFNIELGASINGRTELDRRTGLEIFSNQKDIDDKEKLVKQLKMFEKRHDKAQAQEKAQREAEAQAQEAQAQREAEAQVEKERDVRIQAEEQRKAPGQAEDEKHYEQLDRLISGVNVIEPLLREILVEDKVENKVENKTHLEDIISDMEKLKKFAFEVKEELFNHYNREDKKKFLIEKLNEENNKDMTV